MWPELLRDLPRDVQLRGDRCDKKRCYVRREKDKEKKRYVTRDAVTRNLTRGMTRDVTHQRRDYTQKEE